MKSKTRHPHTTAGRYCLSCAATLLCWIVWLILGAALSWQSYVLVTRDLSVPGFILRRIESSLAAGNLAVTFGRAHLDPSGGVLLENIQLRSRTFDDPLVTGESLYLRKSIWSILAGHNLPDVIRLNGATIRTPAMFSPSGTAEPLIRDVYADIAFAENTWTVRRFTGRIGNVNLTVAGSLMHPRSAQGAPLSAAEISTRFLQYARQAVLALPELQNLDRPSLFAACTPREAGGMDLSLDFVADSYRHPGVRLELGAFSVTGDWTWDGLQPYPLHGLLTTRRLTAPGIVASQVRTHLTLEPGRDVFPPDRVHGEITAAGLDTLGEFFLAPVIAGSWSPWKNQAEWHTAFVADGEVISLGTALDLAHQSGHIHFAGNVTPAVATGFLTRYRPRLEPYFRFADPARLDVVVSLAPGWKFGGLTSRVSCRQVDSRGVLVDAARGRIDVDPDMNFTAYDAYAAIGDTEARGSYWMNFRTLDYRFLLAGPARPEAIAGWFNGNWWPAFWNNFSFPGDPVVADVDVRGNWRDGRGLTYFGDAVTGPAVVLGAGFEHVRTRIFLRPQFVHALDFAADRAGGREKVAGWFKRTSGTTGNQPVVGLEFDLSGNLSPEALRPLGGETAAALLDPWKFSQPPQLRLTGRSTRTGTVTDNQLFFSGGAAGPLKYQHFPLEQIAVNGRVEGSRLRLEQIEIQVAGGRAAGQAELNGPADKRQLRFDLKLANADLTRTILALEEFEAGRTGVKDAVSMTESKFMKRASGGKLDLGLVAQGDPEAPTRLQGTGTIQLTGAELAEINLFGLLSQVLSFSALKLDTAQSSFQMAEGRVFFPDLRITGKSALITAKGSYLLDSKQLDFTAHLKPFEEVRNPFTAVIGMVLNPLTSMFELRLSGRISDPKWTVDLGNTEHKPLEPPAPAPAATTPTAAEAK